MATITRHDESLVERDEVLFPNTNVIDTEPHYSNFTTIQNTLRHRDEEKQINTTNHSRSHSTDNQYRAIRTEIEPSSPRRYHSNEMLYINTQPSSNTFTVPINIQSKKIDGHIFNLTQIVEDIGYDKNTPFIRPSPDPNIKNVSALLNIILKMGGAYGPLANVWRSRLNHEYFQRWYLEKYYQRSASLIQQKTMSNINESTTQNTQARDYRSNININHFDSTEYPINTEQYNDNEIKQIYGYDDIDSTKFPINTEKYYDNEIKQIYGYDDIDRTSSTSSYSSYDGLELKNNHQKSPSITSILKKNNNNNHNSQTKHRVTIREHYPTDDYNQKISSQQINDKKILSDYQQFIQNHPDLHNDPNPEIITKSSPNPVTYQQNISVRYLVPPTPPPPGPLIIREIIPARAPSPPPLIVKYQEPSPPTPPPLILREAPPPPPPHQETTVITKILPPEPQARRVIVEHSTPLPPKPQPIIIEKWLPYKPAPPREVIYERVAEKSAIAEFEPNAVNIERQRRHSAEFESKSSRVSIPVNVQRRNSLDYIEKEQITEQPTGTFDQVAWTTHQQILAMQRRGKEQLQAHRQWAASQWQHANMFLQYPTYLTTPSLVVYQQPVTTSYIQTQQYRQQVQYNPTFVYPFF